MRNCNGDDTDRDSIFFQVHGSVRSINAARVELVRMSFALLSICYVKSDSTSLQKIIAVSPLLGLPNHFAIA